VVSAKFGYLRLMKMLQFAISGAMCIIYLDPKVMTQTSNLQLPFVRLCRRTRVSCYDVNTINFVDKVNPNKIN
jgi:hypothetical protein